MDSRLPLDSSLGALLLQHAVYVVACAEVEVLAHGATIDAATDGYAEPHDDFPLRTGDHRDGDAHDP